MSSFASLPALRLSIDKIVASFNDGLHRSIMKGLGNEFLTIRPFDDRSDRPSQIDWAVTSRLSEDEFDLYARVMEPERKIKVLIILDRYPGMLFPETKPFLAAALAQLFAASAFATNDDVRLAVLYDGGIAETPWCRLEGPFVEFTDEIFDARSCSRYLAREKDVLQYVENANLSDTLIVCISDLRSTSPLTFDFAPRVLSVEKNVRGIYLAIDEWEGYRPASFIADIRDPEEGTGALVSLGKGGSFDKERSAFSERFDRLRKFAFRSGALALPVPLIEENPLVVLVRRLNALWYE